MIEFFKTMLSGMDGDISAKRVSAFALYVAGIVYIFVSESPDPNVLYSVFGSATALLGIGAATHT